MNEVESLLGTIHELKILKSLFGLLCENWLDSRPALDGRKRHILTGFLTALCVSKVDWVPDENARI